MPLKSDELSPAGRGCTRPEVVGPARAARTKQGIPTREAFLPRVPKLVLLADENRLSLIPVKCREKFDRGILRFLKTPRRPFTSNISVRPISPHDARAGEGERNFFHLSFCPRGFRSRRQGRVLAHFFTHTALVFDVAVHAIPPHGASKRRCRSRETRRSRLSTPADGIPSISLGSLPGR